MTSTCSLVDSVAARIRYDDGHYSVDIPPETLSVLRHGYQDDFYYQILSLDGHVLLGDSRIPPMQNPGSLKDHQFSSADAGRLALRVVAIPTTLPPPNNRSIILQAAETRRSQQELSKQMLILFMVPQVILIMFTALFGWLGIRSALSVFGRVERAIGSRSAMDLTPLELPLPVELSPLINAINSLLTKLREDIDRQRRFSSNAAHQLRTPPAGLRTYCHLALKLTHEEKVKEIVKDMDRGMSNMSGLVNQLLALARAEQSYLLSTTKSCIDLNDVARQCTMEFVRTSVPNQIELEFEPSLTPAPITGDQGSIREMLSNLLDNALRYSPVGGTVKVAVQDDGLRCRLSVDDSCPGIPEAERAKVFERFYRIPNTQQQGSGLGLAIVQELATTHGAEIILTGGHSGQGTNICISFPKSQTPSKDTGTNKMASSASTESELSLLRSRAGCSGKIIELLNG